MYEGISTKTIILFLMERLIGEFGNWKKIKKLN